MIATYESIEWVDLVDATSMPALIIVEQDLKVLFRGVSLVDGSIEGRG